MHDTDDIDWDDIYNIDAPEVIQDRIAEIEIPQGSTLKPEDAHLLMQALQTCTKGNEKIQKKLENFDQVRYDLLHLKNVDAYQQLL